MSGNTICGCENLQKLGTTEMTSAFAILWAIEAFWQINKIERKDDNPPFAYGKTLKEQKMAPTSILPSTSGEESVSVDSKGEVTLSSSVFTCSRFLRSIRKRRVPIIFLLVSFVSFLTIFVAAISWDLTYSAGTTAAETLSASLQQQFLKTIIANVINVFEGTEETTQNLVASWADGTFHLSDREAVQKVCPKSDCDRRRWMSQLTSFMLPS
ncbi:hypothetical protein BDZ88DRAFT_15143 [Geranomyces variabilis]|nr:hypothetical protein BDZ88DRAFT_15143 [Geranomyces variabilis]